MIFRGDTSQEGCSFASLRDSVSDYHDWENHSDISSPAYSPYRFQGRNAETGHRREFESSQEGSCTGYPDSPAPTFDVQPPYPAWNAGVPLSTEEIKDVFLDIMHKFGFQSDSMHNMFDLMMQLLDSRASRMTPNQALISLHADYIGGRHANYRKWYFAAQLDLDDAIGQMQNPGLSRLRPTNNNLLPSEQSIAICLDRWRTAMNNMTQCDRVRQIALYLLCWGEAAQVRFAPECLCFIFKCADDYYRSPECQSRIEPVPEGFYLRSVIKPLYRFIRDQGFEAVDGKFVRRERDHEDIIGYDDINQLFWHREGIARIVLHDKTRLADLPSASRFMRFGHIDWKRVFYKTYYETRSIGHLLVNFNRIFVIHIAVYYFYTAYNSPGVYRFQGKDSLSMTLSATALGGAVATVIMIIATFLEFSYIPTTWINTSHLARRLLFLLAMLALTSGPTFYIATVENSGKGGTPSLVLAATQFITSVVATLIFAIVPSGRMFGDRVRGRSRRYLASQTFTASYPPLDYSEQIVSILLWLLVFGCKFIESYLFITLSLRNSIQAMVGMKVQGCADRFFGNSLCKHQAAFTLVLMYIMDLALFFLDTYPWYIIWSTVFSIGKASLMGQSIWTSWKDIYAKLPERIYKMLEIEHTDTEPVDMDFISQIWNAIIMSMYREHLLSIDLVQQLLYHRVYAAGQRGFKKPQFLCDQGYKKEAFPSGGEAERRISFFAQSLGSEMPCPNPIGSMPTFTVLTPHYNEKILLSLREVIREEDQDTRITLLEYLKQLHPKEWENFTKETKIIVGPEPYSLPNVDLLNIHLLPLDFLGFNSSSPESILRTRVWASLRTQTLFRTVAGMMNYSKAIKLLYRVEHPELVQLFGGNLQKLEREFERMARRKFKFIVSMQRYSKFNKAERENVEFLLRAYPDLQIAYFETEPSKIEGGEPRIFSAMIDGHSETSVTGKRQPKYRIELPGNPILGDGKADNQNHSIIFYRGEYIQLIDANQDNYLEECLKIRHVLAEFEEIDIPVQSPYGQWNIRDMQKAPVAIVGAREYIFSENIGVLGDYAAGKEQTFRTLMARLISWIGGRLHYGHPDFFNAVYMTTRGGVSKAQKGLHLNEDIYAGMNALGRGGRIKHTEYYQCGKGRDLGFGTIINFQTKIGTGMAEQMLSREYYYLGTQLPIDRFLTFYYTHPGFQMNHIQILLSVQVFLLTMLFLGTLNSSLQICKYTSSGRLLEGQEDCYDLVPVFEWIGRSIVCIFLVFVISFLPPFLQELVERGTWKAFLRLSKQLLSLSPVFESVSTQIYVHSIFSNLAFGGARYISTGRGFATKRNHFNHLFSRFAVPSIYLGMRILTILVYVSLTLWTNYLLFFWVFVLSLCIAPFWFNPHQFSFSDFLIDYREFLRWMCRGNWRSHAASWIGYCRLSRTMTTGYKRHKLGRPSENLAGDFARPPLKTLLLSEIVFPICIAVIFVIAYMFVKSFPDPAGEYPPNPLIRIAVISFGPVAWNAAVLSTLFLVSLYIGPLINPTFPRFGAVIAFTAHILGVVGVVAFFEFLWLLEACDVAHTILGIICVISIHRAIYKTLISVFLSRELPHDETNCAWWTGRWSDRGLGTHVIKQRLREFIVKITELSLWGSDLLVGHLLLVMLTPPILVPYFDRFHTTILCKYKYPPLLSYLTCAIVWLRPSKHIRSPVFSMKQQRQRRRIVIKYGSLYIGVIGVFVALVALPAALHERLKFNYL